MNPYNLHINLYDLAFGTAIVTGLNFALLLAFAKTTNKVANRFLSLALLTVILWLTRVLCADIALDTWLPLQFSLALGPLLYFYVLKITRPQYKLGLKSLLHFIPVLLQQAVLLWATGKGLMGSSDAKHIYSFIQPGPILNLLAFISVSIYLLWCFGLIEVFYKGLKFNYLSDRYRYQWRWLYRLLSGFTLLWLMWIPYTAGHYFYYHQLPEIHACYPLYLLLVAMMIGIAATAFLKPEGAAVPIYAPPVAMPLPKAVLRQKSVWLKKAMETGRFYEDAELTLGKLAGKLAIHPQELSQIINIALKKNFNDFINEYRVQEVARKIQDPAYNHITLLGIAFDAGFNSKSTFHRTFRQITGKTPAEYKDNAKKEVPSYFLTPSAHSAAVISNHGTVPKWSFRKLNCNFMFRNYLKIGWRNLLRQRLYSLINITGLATGLAVCMIIMLYVAHEHSYDSFHKNAARIMKPYSERKINGNNFGMDQMSYASGPIIKESQPAVADYMRTQSYFTSPVIISNPSQPDQKFAGEKLLFADPGFFNFFSFKLLKGQPSTVLNKPFSVVLSQDMARKYFGDENPVGKLLTIKMDSTYTYQVTGVAENCPSNSSIEYNFVASNLGFVSTKEGKNALGDQKFGGGLFDIYLLLKPGADTASLRRGLQSLNSNKDPHDQTTSLLLPLTDRHLKRGRDGANLKYLTIFPLIAGLILLLALVNYMSLSTARATLRAKEIGVRKVSGASRKSVALQFYIESALYATISFVLGYVLCCLFKPAFFNILQLKIDGTFLYSPRILLSLLGLLLLTIIVAGSYPSLVLSAFKPVVTLKGKMGKQSGGVIIRKIFTTLQFAISVALIICGIVIDRQLYFFRHADIGVDRENVVMISVSSTLNNYLAFKHDITSLPGIARAATSRYGMFSYYDMMGVSGRTKDEQMMLRMLTVDKNFVSVVGLKWKYAPLPGTQLDAGKKVVINELAAEKLHFPANAIGSFINNGAQNTEVAGVLKNFNFGSLEDKIQPLGIFIAPDTSKAWARASGGRYLIAKINPHTNLPTLLATIQSIYKKYDKDTPFDYTFMDDAFNAQYKAEDRLASVFSIFTVITIVLATMGLFGLAAFTIEQRTKEIGIRKVMGASIGSINTLLSMDFLKLVLLSIILASPVAWWFMHNWLQGFAYRINIQWWMFAGAGILAVIVAVVTVSYHAIKAALANPVNSLRSE